MAFPTTSVLTTFTGTDENPLSEGGAWAATTIRNGGQVRPQRLSNACATTSGSTNEAVWAASVADDQEVFATLGNLPNVGQGPNVSFRITGEGADAAECYNLSYARDTGFRVFRMDSLGGGSYSFTQLGSTDATVMSAGDSFGASAIGSTIRGYHKPSAGAWTELNFTGTITDANFATGKIGLALTDTGAEWLDDFGGGASVTSVDPTWTSLPRRGFARVA